MSKRILIIEDEADMQELIKIYIAKSNLDVEIHSSYTGEDGIKIYKELMEKGEKPDVVIMDLKLPGMDGVETTKRIIKMDKDAAIYGFTAFFDTNWADDLRKAGAKDVIPRTIGFDGFANRLKEILQE
ncbi:MAG: response regulator [Thermoplasmata archaeon]|nr:MAG: response regulator [Thermoplasmata archaeon]